MAPENTLLGRARAKCTRYLDSVSRQVQDYLEYRDALKTLKRIGNEERAALKGSPLNAHPAIKVNFRSTREYIVADFVRALYEVR
jgi:hypothetical protein